MTKNKWPSDYPKHLDIPPEAAAGINDTLHRIVRNQVPNDSDFLASYKDPRQKYLARNPAIKKKPSYYGTSFFSTKEGIDKVVERSPEKFANDFVAIGKIEPIHGKGEYSANTDHVTVWFYEGIYPKGFKVI